MPKQNTANISEKIILQCLKKMPADLESLNTVKRNLARKGIGKNTMPKTAILIKSYHKLVKEHKIEKSPALEKLLMKRAVRTLSGVTIITVLTKPFFCPGKCIYCPSEEGMPKSYISDEPAANRALRLNFDPFEQVRLRILALEDNGHPTDKIELIVKGGTWDAYPLDYRYWFILRCFEACNKNQNGQYTTLSSRANARDLCPIVISTEASVSERSGEIPYTSSTAITQGIRDSSATLRSARNDKTTRATNINEWRKRLSSQQKKNETAKHRIIGLTLETRPDFINNESIKEFRELGCTRIELGVQNTNDDILELIKRGHTTEHVKIATALLKNNGFKVDYHLMPQLPGSTPAKDLKMMLEVFDNPDYRPDMIKIYPCTVIKNSELNDWFKAGKYKPYSTKQLIKMLVNFKTKVPRYVRISRLIRDIPGHHVQAGNTITNLRQIIQAEMKKDGLECNCLRCREIGHRTKSKIKNQKSKIKMFIDKYEASGGVEYFLSFEDSKRKAVYAFCRFRIAGLSPFPRGNAKGFAVPCACHAFIRELHTYGQMVNIGKTNKDASQHFGFGKKLVAEVEKICKRNKIHTLAVISGVGVRDYYRHLGYKLENTYMVKKLG